jgi:uncharacterized protein YjiK
MRVSQEYTYSTLLIKINKFCEYAFHFGFRTLVLISGLIFFSFCNPATDNELPVNDGHEYYHLENPDARYKMPDYLEEISGLSYYGKGRIACIQDEKANIYVWNLEKEKIVDAYDFGKDADYEDIAVVGKTAYILRNNGNIYRVDDFRHKDRKVHTYKTPLKEKNNTEGLAYDPLSNTLLVACKGSPSIEEENPYEGYKAIYKFDLEEEELITKPYYLIDLECLDSYIDQGAFARFSVRIAKKLHIVESETSFQPSGLAIHPLHGDIYIISSVGKLLIILNRKGKVLDVQELDPVEFRQPEGICFSPAGDMFISNEGQGGKGYILEFNFHEKN